MPSLLAPLRLGPVLEPALLVAVTVAGCWALTDGLIRRVGWLRPLFGLKPVGRVVIRTSAALPKCLRTAGP